MLDVLERRSGRQRWFGHGQRDSEYIGRMMRLELPGRKLRGKPKRRMWWLDVVKEDMK